MISVTTHDLLHLLATYSYWAVFVFIAIESMGIPFPGETTLLIAAIYAGTTHQLSILLVIAAAASGAILGDNLGFWVGREGGYRLLRITVTMPTPYLYEKLAQAHHEDVLREAERLRLLVRLPRHRRGMSRRAASKLGVLLLKLGTWLKQFEQPSTALEEHV